MATLAVTGKAATFSYATVSGTAQITSFDIDETADSNTIQTLGGSAAVAQGVASAVNADFLFDGGAGAGGFYDALKSALDAGTAGTLALDIDGGTWAGQALVTALSVASPADDAVTCSATFTVDGALPFTEAGGLAQRDYVAAE